MIRATLPQRTTDAWGSGAYGAPRGTRKHKGIDFVCVRGTIINSHIIGVVTKLGYPYSDDLSYRYVEVTDAAKLRHRFFYVEPLVEKGDVIITDTPLGVAQDISSRYRDPDKPPMDNHCHYEILYRNGKPIDPEKWQSENDQ